jgi:hypothetical protein
MGRGTVVYPEQQSEQLNPTIDLRVTGNQTKWIMVPARAISFSVSITPPSSWGTTGATVLAQWSIDKRAGYNFDSSAELSSTNSARRNVNCESTDWIRLRVSSGDSTADKNADYTIAFYA